MLNKKKLKKEKKKRNKKKNLQKRGKKVNKRKEYLLSLGLFLFAVMFSFIFTFVSHNSNINLSSQNIFQEIPSITGHATLEDSINETSDSKLIYDSTSKIMVDRTGLEFNMSEKILINNERGFEFVVRDFLQEYKLDSLSPESEKESLSNSYDFVKETDSGGVLIKEEFRFSENSSVKIVHSVNNTNKFALEKPIYYYVFDLFPDDKIYLNNSKCDYQGKCEDFGRTEKSMVRFNKEYYFAYHDLTRAGFILEDIKFENNKLYLGFTNDKFISLDSGGSIELDPTVYYYTEGLGTNMAPLDDNMFVIAWYEEANEEAVMFAIYYTNGTQFGNNVTIDPNVGSESVNGIGVDAFNSTHFVISWFDQDTDYVDYSIYNTNFQAIVDQAAVMVPFFAATSDVATLNSTHFVVVWSELDPGDVVRYKVFDSEGTLVKDYTGIEYEVGDCGVVSVAAFNSSHFVTCYYDDYEDGSDSNNYVKCDVYDIDGTEIVELYVSGNMNSDYNHWYADVETFNSTHFVVGWFQKYAWDYTFAVYDAEGNENVEVDVDSDCFETWQSNKLSVATLNSTHFVMVWFDYDTDDISFGVYDANGNAITGILDASTSAVGGVAAAVSEKVATEIEICEDNFVLSWKDSSGVVWRTYYPNGTLWNGVCCSVCGYDGSGDWYINCANNCTYPSNVLGDGSDIYISGNGHINIEANITNFDDIHVDGGTGHCIVTCRKGGCFKT